MALLQIQNVSKHYNGHTALSDVSLEIERGKVFGLLGPNGAGKTSLIRIINCITAPDSGIVLFDGESLAPRHTERIGYLPEERGLYRKMKVGDQALYFARLKGLGLRDAEKRLRVWFEKFEIEAWWSKKVEELSKGMQQKVQFICTILHEPELLIFDEPFSGFDPVNSELLKREILDLKAKGHTIIFSTHNMQSVEEICDDIALINRSQLVLSGNVHEVKRRYAKPTFSLRVDGAVSDALLAELDPLSHAIELGESILRLELGEGEDIRSIIGRIPSDYNILEIRQEEISMHDIFLKVVNGTK